MAEITSENAWPIKKYGLQELIAIGNSYMYDEY